MKLTVAVLALLCLGMGANASSKALGVKFNKTANGVHVDMPDITVPTVSMPEVKVAVSVKKPSLNTTTIDLPDFTIPTTEITVPTLPRPNIDLAALASLLSKGGNSTASLAGMLKRSNVDLTGLQNALQSALQQKASLTAEVVGHLQTLATAVYQAKYNVTSRIADMALEALSKKPTITIPVPQVDLSPLMDMLHNVSMPQFQMPQIDLSALQALFDKNATLPKVDVASLIAALVSAKAAATPQINMPTVDMQAILGPLMAKVNASEKFDINKVVDMAAVQQSLAQLAQAVEMPKINLMETIQNAIEARKNATMKDMESLVTALAALSQKNATADLVGLVNSMKNQRTINFTIPTLQLPKVPTVNVAGIVDTVKTLKNVTVSMAADELKSAAILAWLKDAGYYQIRDAVTGAASGKGSKGTDGSVTVNLGKN